MRMFVGKKVHLPVVGGIFVGASFRPPHLSRNLQHYSAQRPFTAAISLLFGALLGLWLLSLLARFGSH
jgi:hypothetical protein